MNIFDKRPLALTLSILLGLFVFFTNLGIYGKIILALLLLLLFAISFVPRISKIIKGRLGKTIIIVSSVALLFSYLYFETYFFFGKRFDEPVDITATIIDMDINNGRSDLTVKTDNVNGERFTSGKLRATVYLDNADKLAVGNIIEIKGTIIGFEKESNDGFNAKSYYTAKGYSGEIIDITSLEVIGYEGEPFQYKIEQFRSKLTRNIILQTNSSAGGMLSALMLGDKDYLTGQVELDFTRTGTTHILALSGMHLVILILGIAKLLRKLRINRKIVDVITIFLTAFYVVLTGCGSSIVRAGIMLIITILLRFMSRNHDSFTSLCLAVFLIVLFQPYAIFDLSLWLSALATMGVVIYAEYSALYPAKTKLQTFKTAIMFSIFAICSTLILTANTFKFTSVISPLATIIFSFLTELYLYMGIVLVLIGKVIPIGKILAYFGDFIIWLINKFAEPDFVYIVTDFISVKVLIAITTVVLLSFIVLNIKQKKKFVVVITLLFAFTITMASGFTHITESHDTCTYIRDDKKEQITVTSNGEISVIDIATYTKSTAYDTGNNILVANLTHIDNYILLKYNKKLPEALYILLENYKIDKVYLPDPKNQEELLILDALLYKCKDFKVEFTKYNEEDKIELGEYTFTGIYLGRADEDEDRLMFTLSHENRMYTYLTTQIFNGITKNRAIEIMCESHSIIFGQHGEWSECKFPYEIEGISRMIISGEKLKIHESTYEFYQNTEIIFSPQKVNLLN